MKGHSQKGTKKDSVLNCGVPIGCLSTTTTQIAAAGNNTIKIVNILNDTTPHHYILSTVNSYEEKESPKVFSALQYCPNDDIHLGVCSSIGRVMLFNVEKFSKFQLIGSHSRRVNRLEWVDDKTLLTAANDGLLSYWDIRLPPSNSRICAIMVETGTPIDNSSSSYSSQQSSMMETESNNTNSCKVLSLSIRPSGNFTQVFAGTSMGTILAFDLRKININGPQASFSLSKSKIDTNIYQEVSTADITSIEFNPTKPNLLVCGAALEETGIVKVWDVDSGKITQNFETIAPIKKVMWRIGYPNPQVAICSSSTDNCVHIYDCNDPLLPVASFKDHTACVSDMSWYAGTGDFLISGSTDNNLRIRHISTAHKPRKVEQRSNFATFCGPNSAKVLISKQERSTNNDEPFYSMEHFSFSESPFSFNTPNTGGFFSNPGSFNQQNLAANYPPSSPVESQSTAVLSSSQFGHDSAGMSSSLTQQSFLSQKGNTLTSITNQNRIIISPAQIDFNYHKFSGVPSPVAEGVAASVFDNLFVKNLESQLAKDYFSSDSSQFENIAKMGPFFNDSQYFFKKMNSSAEKDLRKKKIAERCRVWQKLYDECGLFSKGKVWEIFAKLLTFDLENAAQQSNNLNQIDTSNGVGAKNSENSQQKSQNSTPIPERLQTVNPSDVLNKNSSPKNSFLSPTSPKQNNESTPSQQQSSSSKSSPSKTPKSEEISSEDDAMNQQNEEFNEEDFLSKAFAVPTSRDHEQYDEHHHSSGHSSSSSSEDEDEDDDEEEEENGEDQSNGETEEDSEGDDGFPIQKFLTQGQGKPKKKKQQLPKKTPQNAGETMPRLLLFTEDETNNSNNDDVDNTNSSHSPKSGSNLNSSTPRRMNQTEQNNNEGSKREAKGQENDKVLVLGKKDSVSGNDKKSSDFSFEFMDFLMDTFHFATKNADIQFSVALISTFGMFLKIRETVVALVLEYSEILIKRRLYLEAQQTLKFCPFQYVQDYQKNFLITSLNACCGGCGATLERSDEKQGSNFKKCKKCLRNVNECTICKELAKGILHFCFYCGAPSHLACLKKWSSNYNYCPNCLNQYSF